MKIAIIYTAATPQMITVIEEELRSAVSEEKLQIMIYSDPTILADIILNSGITASSAKRIYRMYMDAVSAGAEIVYNICSSVGALTEAAKPLFEMMRVPLIRVDEEMAIKAINEGNRIGVLATLETTLEPTKFLLKNLSQMMKTDIEIVDALAEGAFGKTQPELEQILVGKALVISDKVDVIVLAQASMALCEEKIAQATGKKVLSSPRYGARAVAEAIASLKHEGK